MFRDGCEAISRTDVVVVLFCWHVCAVLGACLCCFVGGCSVVQMPRCGKAYVNTLAAHDFAVAVTYGTLCWQSKGCTLFRPCSPHCTLLKICSLLPTTHSMSVHGRSLGRCFSHKHSLARSCFRRCRLGCCCLSCYLFSHCYCCWAFRGSCCSVSRRCCYIFGSCYCCCCVLHHRCCYALCRGWWWWVFCHWCCCRDLCGRWWW